MPMNAGGITLSVLLPDVSHYFHPQSCFGNLGGERGHRTAEEYDREIELDLRLDKIIPRECSALQIGEIRVHAIRRLIQNLLDGLTQHHASSLTAINKRL